MSIEFPILTTHRLLLRPLKVSDAEGLYTCIAASRKEFAHWFIWAQTSTLESVIENLQQAEAARALGRAWHFALCHSDSGSVIGRIGFTEMDERTPSAELGYWLRTEEAGQGLMTEALRAILSYAFDTGALSRVVAYADRENTASQRVLEKLSFQKQGLRLRRVQHPTRGWRDHYAYTFMRENRATLTLR